MDERDKETLEDIRRRSDERITSGMVGGVREWFDVDRLLGIIDKLLAKEEVEDTRCTAICPDNGIVQKFGFIVGSRCTSEEGHDVPRNGVGHYFSKWR